MELSPDDCERLASGLRILALRRLSDPDAAEEVVQETLTRALEALRDGRVRDRDRLGAYVRGVALNVIADAHRERYRRRERHVAGGEESIDPAGDPLSSLISEEERRQVRRALDELSGSDRAILRWCIFDGLSPSEVAGRLGQPAPRVRKRKSRAIAKLRAAFVGMAASGHALRLDQTSEMGHASAGGGAIHNGSHDER